MTFSNPPKVNGLAEFCIGDTFDEVKVLAIQTKLIAIRDSFVATEEQPVADVFYLTSEYNKANADLFINGDTCEYCLNYTKEVV